MIYMYKELCQQFLLTKKEFDLLKSRDNIPIRCLYCENIFTDTKNQCRAKYKNNKSNTYFCSSKCCSLYRTNPSLRQEVNCLNCGEAFIKALYKIKKFPNHFCTRSCAVTYNNKHKSYGIRRSKFEIYAEEQLSTLYPSLEILYSNKEVIGSELDIYIPSLKLAIEIQGIFHYKPIYGEEKLTKIKRNDYEKIVKCHKSEITLIHIDISIYNNTTVTALKDFFKRLLAIIKKASIEAF